MRPQRLALGELDVDGGQKLGERVHLLDLGRIVRAIDQHLLALFQRLGGSDIGQNHEFFDQLVRIQTRRREHAVDLALRRQDQLALRQVQLQRRAMGARDFQRVIGLPQRLQDRLQQRRRRLVRPAVNRRLRLRIGEFCSRAHHYAVEGVAGLAALFGDGHAHGQRWPLLIGAQRTQIV